jgi:hypothetical protein
VAQEEQEERFFLAETKRIDLDEGDASASALYEAQGGGLPLSLARECLHGIATTRKTFKGWIGYVALFASASCFALLRHRPSVVTDRKHSETAAIVSNRCIFVVNVY